MNTKREREIVSVYSYQDEHGKEVFQVVRYAGKDFRVRHKKGKTWDWKAPKRNVPYHLPDVVAAKLSGIIYIVEGEKDADSLQALGCAATTNRGGCGNTESWNDFTSFFAGKTCVILYDADDPGVKHAARVKDILKPHAGHIVILDLPGQPAIKDISDWLEVEGNNVARLSALANGAIDTAAFLGIPGASDEVPAELRGDAFEHPADQAIEPEPPQLCWQPFPLEALPYALRVYSEEMAAAVQVDPCFIAFPAIVCAAGLLGNARVLRLLDTWTEPSVLFGCLVADSSSRKSPSMERVLDPVVEMELELAEKFRRQCEWFAREDRAWDAAVDRPGGGAIGDMAPSRPVKPQRERILIGDITVETVIRELANNPKGLLLKRDELNGWFSSFGRYAAGKGGSSDLSFWLEAHGARSYVYDRKSGEQQTLVVRRSAVSIFGTIQTKVVAKVLVGDFFDTGMVARILLAQPAKTIGKWERPRVSPHVKDCYWTLMKRLRELDLVKHNLDELAPGVVILDGATEEVWAAWYDKWQAQQFDSDGDIASLLAKLEAMSMRFALLFAVCDYVMGENNAQVVTAEHVVNGLKLAEWFRDEAMRLYRLIYKGESAIEEERLQEWIESKGGWVTGRDLYLRNKVRFDSTEHATAYLEGLVRSGVLDKSSNVPGRSAGRKTTHFRALTTKLRTTKATKLP